MLDISGGGMKITCNEKYNVGQKLEIETILDIDKIIVKGEIIRRIKNETNYLYALKFDIVPAIQEKIIKDVFAIMRRKLL
jgi:c-di-GMP-binding flagellar brake protein YcgR